VTDLLAAGRRAKAEHQRALAEALTRPPEPDPEPDDVALDALADRVAERIAGRLAENFEDSEPEPKTRSRDFDGGARQTVPTPPEDHGRWLFRVIRERRADAGARF
jgi:hypothetical protein